MLVTIYNVTRADLSSVGGPKDGWVSNSLAVELDIDTSEPLFIWDPLKHVPLNASHNPSDGSGSNSSDPWEWFHMNSIQSVNGGYLVNSRQTWSSYFINKQGGIEREINGETGGNFDLPSGYNFVSPFESLSALLSTDILRHSLGSTTPALGPTETSPTNSFTPASTTTTAI